MHKPFLSQPIGTFDSGLGGLTILSEINRRLPNEQLIYLADSKNAPYGEKSAEAIVNISKKNTEFLLSKNCKMIVVACNTSTTNAIGILRKTYNVPFIGIEPAIKPAALSSKNRTVGVLATKGTLSSDLFSKTAKTFASNTRIVEVVGIGIVEAIEKNATETEDFHKLLAEQLLPFKEAGIDTLVLGCSHYPFIMPLLQKILGDEVSIIDSGFAVARQAEKVLHNRNLNIPSKKISPKPIRIYSNKTSTNALDSVLGNLELENVEILEYIEH